MPIAPRAEGSAGMPAWSAVFTICNSAIGAGILSFPYAFHSTGLIGGLLLCLTVASIIVGTLFVVITLASRLRAPSYQKVVELLLGPSCSTFLSAVTSLYLFGACVAYLIIIGDVFKPLIAQLPFIEKDSVWSDRRMIIAMSGLFVILPLALSRSMKALAGVSSMALLVISYTAAAIVIRAVQHLSGTTDIPEHVVAFRLDWQAVSCIPIMCFAFHCHVQSVLIFHELAPNPTLLPCLGQGKGPSALQQREETPMLNPLPSFSKMLASSVQFQRLLGMLRVAATAVSIITFLYTTVGFFGYLAHPNVGSNVLNSFPASDPLIQVARGVVGCAVMFHYPMSHHAARSAFDDLLCRLMSWQPSPTIPWARLVPETLVYFFGTLLLAMKIHNLGVVFRVLGGTGATLLIFIMPGAMLLAVARAGGILAARRAMAAAVLASGRRRLQLDRATSTLAPAPSLENSMSDPLLRLPNGDQEAEAAANGHADEEEETLRGARGALDKLSPRCAAACMAAGVALLLLGAAIFGITITNVVLEGAGNGGH